jgi:hypothetical protein
MTENTKTYKFKTQEKSKNGIIKLEIINKATTHFYLEICDKSNNVKKDTYLHCKIPILGDDICFEKIKLKIKRHSLTNIHIDYAISNIVFSEKIIKNDDAGLMIKLEVYNK